MKKLVSVTVLAGFVSLLAACAAESAPLIEITGETHQTLSYPTTETYVRKVLTTSCNFSKAVLCEIKSSYGKVQITWLPDKDRFQIGIRNVRVIRNHPETATLEELREGVSLSDINWTKKGDSSWLFAADVFVLHLQARELAD